MRKEHVILLHGLARTQRSMSTMARILREHGFEVINSAYPSRKYCIEELAELYISEALAQCGKDGEIHFVTHSLGGILVRQYLQHHDIPGLRRIVMLGPPNRGSEVVDYLQHVPGFCFLNGPAGFQLGTGADSLPLRLSAIPGEIGIIAGSVSINLFLSLFLSKPDDGKVSVSNTYLLGMKDHLVVPVSHPFLMKNRFVIEQVLHFLECGEFCREE